jgi:membrane protease YdiL (CAAX protease family)
MKISRQFINIIILIIILGTGLTAFFKLQGNQGAQLAVGIVISAAYAVWGLLHHWIVGDLHRKVVIEYVLISAIAVSMLLIIFSN